MTRLKDLAARCQIANRVHFAGWQAAIPEILLASDLMILPSRWEGMPNVLLEAMACGRPVMCSAAEGVAEVLGPLADDQTAPVGNAQLLVRKAIAILQNGEFARQLGLRNRLRVVAEFSLERMVHHYEDLFQTLVHARQTGRGAKIFCPISNPLGSLEVCSPQSPRSIHAVDFAATSQEVMLTIVGEWISWVVSGAQWQRVAKNVSHRHLSA